MFPHVAIFDWFDTLIDLKRTQAVGGALKLRSEAVPVLDIMKREKVIMGVISASPGHRVRNEVKTHGLQGYFAAVVGRGDNELHKPDSLAWDWWKHRAKVKHPKSVWMIGDSKDDKAFADVIGADFFLIEDLLQKIK